MIDETGTERDSAFASTSEEAERLINQRIEELRAAALAPVPGMQHQHQPHAPAPAPHAPHDAVLVPTQAPTVARQLASPTLQHPAPSVSKIAESVERIEASLHEDVARLERLVRSWGNPRETMDGHASTTYQLLEQLSAGISTQLSHLGSGLASRIDARSNIQPMIEAMARWSVDLQQQTTAHSSRLQGQLRAIYEASEKHAAARDARLAETFERTTREQVELTDQARATLAKVGDQAAQLRDALGRDVARSTAKLLDTLQDLQNAVGQPGPRLDALDASVGELGTRVDAAARRADERLDEHIALLRRRLDSQDEAWTQRVDQIDAALQHQRGLLERSNDTISSTLQTATDLLEQRLTRRLDQQAHETASVVNEQLGVHAKRLREQGMKLGDGVQELERKVDALAAGQDGQVERLSGELGLQTDRFLAELDTHLEQRFERVIESMGERQAALETAVGTLGEQLEATATRITEQVDGAIEQLGARVEASVAELASQQAKQTVEGGASTVESMGMMAAAIEALGVRQQRSFEALKEDVETMRDNVLSTHESVVSAHQSLVTVHESVEAARETTGEELAKLEQHVTGMRLSAAEDTELVFDTVTRGWMSTQDLLQAMDERVAQLEALLGSDEF